MSQLHPLRVVPILILALGVAGCGSPNPTPSAEDDQAHQPPSQLFEGALDRLATARTPSEFRSIAGDLAQYVSKSEDVIERLSADRAERLALLIGSGDLMSARDRVFVPSDGEYLRQCMFLGRLSESLRRPKENERERTRRLFDWVLRHVQLAPDGFPTGSAFDVLVRGIGSANDRTWVYLELLRQCGTHGFLLREADGRLLCGAAVDDEPLLFDPRLGVPLTSSEASELLANEGAVVLAPLLPEMVAPRMAFLDDQLGRRSRSRLRLDIDAWIAALRAAGVDVSFAGASGSDDGGKPLKAWEHPRTMRQFLADSSKTRLLIASTNTFWLRDFDSPRLLQLRGRRGEAVRQLMDLHTEWSTEEISRVVLENPNLTPIDRMRFVRQTPQDIHVFIGQCKLDETPPAPGIARSWFERYLERYTNAYLTVDDVLEWGGLCDRLMNSEEPAIERIRSRLPDELREPILDVVEQYRMSSKGVATEEMFRRRMQLEELESQADSFGATETQLEEIASRRNALAEAAAELNEVVQVQLEVKQRLAETLDAQLDEKDFYEEEAFAASLDGDRGKKLREALPDSLADLPANQRRLWNRSLLNHLFPGLIAPTEGLWIPLAVRNLATCLRMEGRFEEALALLREDRPYLDEAHRRELNALADWWERMESNAPGRNGQVSSNGESK